MTIPFHLFQTDANLFGNGRNARNPQKTAIRKALFQLIQPIIYIFIYKGEHTVGRTVVACDGWKIGANSWNGWNGTCNPHKSAPQRRSLLLAQEMEQ